MKNPKRIIILHQYYCPEHFLGLYSCDGVEIDFRNIDPFIYIYKLFVGKASCVESIKFMFKAFYNFVCLFFIRDSIVIIGLSPFSPMLFLCVTVLRNNTSVFFTSWAGWRKDGRPPLGFSFLRKRWEHVIKKYCSAIAGVNLECVGYWKKFLPSYLVEHSIGLGGYVVKTKYAKTNKFLFLGRKTRYKNYDTLIDIFLKKNSIRLDIVGDRKFTGELRADRIKGLGRKNKDWIKKNLCLYDAVILPSDWKEPFGIVLIEAMAAGVPLIVTPTAGTETIFRDGKYIFTADSSKSYDIEKTIFSFLEFSRDERKKLGESLREIAERYSDRCIAERWMKIITDISEQEYGI